MTTYERQRRSGPKPCSHCGKPRDVTYSTYCKDCRATWMRHNRPKHHELSEEARAKLNCRAYTKTLQERGKLPKGPCEACGREDAWNHHPDYSNPRYYIRLCKVCLRATQVVAA